VKKYIVKRLIISVFILIFVAFIIYVLMRSLPTSYLEQVARQKSMQPGSKSFEEWMAQLAGAYNLDKGIVPGFFGWLGTMLRGDFGDSWKWTVPVVEKFNDTVWLSFAMDTLTGQMTLIPAPSNPSFSPESPMFVTSRPKSARMKPTRRTVPGTSRRTSTST
jgi:ABC-type dipeptide/oligopeptide/nickel transport system permease component